MIRRAVLQDTHVTTRAACRASRHCVAVLRRMLCCGCKEMVLLLLSVTRRQTPNLLVLRGSAQGIVPDPSRSSNPQLAPKNFAGFKPEDDLRKSCCSSAPTIRETFSSMRNAQTLRTERYGELQALDIHRCWVILGLLWRMANAAAETDTRGLDRQLF